MYSRQGLLGLFALCLFVDLAAADVYIMTSAYILDPLPDIPADFGPDVPDDGVEGILRSADPEDACSPFSFTDFDTPWIALIARQQQLHPNNCTFDVKVWNAQNAGAMAAIVYDDVYESLIIMSKPKGHPDPFIPSVFVSEKAGIIMRKLMTIDTIRVRITPLSSVAWLSMLMSAFLGVLALGVVLATFYVMRSWSMWLTGMHVRGTGPGAAGGQAAQTQPGQARPGQPHETGLPAESLRLLPVLVFEPSAPSRSSRAASAAAAAGSAISSSASQPALLLRASAATGAEVYGAQEEVAEGDELQPLLGSLEGDVEEGLRRHELDGSHDLEDEGEEFEEAHDAASRSSSESGCGPGAGVVPRLPRPPGAHAGETKRVCAICFESYAEGEKIRVLPCAHRFHMGCVDQWLGGHRTCPVCKHDASQQLPHPSTSGAGPGGSGRRAGGAAGAAVNGWALLFQGLVDLLRHSRVIPNQRPRAGPNAAPRQQQRLRSRRQLPPAPRAVPDVPDLREPLMPAAQPQTVAANRASAAAVVAAPAATAALALAGDVEAPGPSRPSAAVAAAPADRSAGDTVSGPIAIPPSAASGTEPPQPSQQPQEQQQARRGAGVAAAAPGGPVSLVRAALDALWRSGRVVRSAPQYSPAL